MRVAHDAYLCSRFIKTLKTPQPLPGTRSFSRMHLATAFSNLTPGTRQTGQNTWKRANVPLSSANFSARVPSISGNAMPRAARASMTM